MPLTIIIYRFVPQKSKQPAFIIISMLFLAVSDILSAIGMIAAAMITAVYGKFSVTLSKKKTILFIFTIVIMLMHIISFIVFSMYNFQRFDNAHSFLRFCSIGVPFFFFQAVRFTIDVYTGKIRKNPDINDSLEFLLFYPCLVMGPVMTYNEHIEMLSDSRQCSERIGEGLGLFIKGLSKKLLLADTIGLVFSPLYGDVNKDTTLLMSWFIVLAFALELFFTVAGYGDMAKGIALCYGFKIPANYKYPLLSGSLSRFGSEWNISVVSWCKSCFSPMLRGSRWQSIIGVTDAWIIVGFWYRPELQVIIWCAWLGFWIGMDGYIRNQLKRIPSVIYGIVFFIVTFFGWAFLSADSIAGGVNMVGLLVGSSTSIFRAQDFYYISQAGIVILIAVYSATGHFNAFIERMRRIPVFYAITTLFGFIFQILLLLLCIVVLVTNNDITALQLKGAI